MRDLLINELAAVSGAGCSPAPPSRGPRGNNGFGNGSDAPNTAAPGGSGGTPGDKNFSNIR
jgi:hypothetical protein